MVINIESIELLIKILEKEFWMKPYIICLLKQRNKGVLDHQNSFGKIIERDYIKKELIKVIEDKHYEDEFEFYKLKNNIEQLN